MGRYACILFVILHLVFVISCGDVTQGEFGDPLAGVNPSPVGQPEGGDGDSNDPQPSISEDGPPAIDDDHEDGLFRYSDAALYGGSADGSGRYILSVYPQEGCSYMMGESVPAEMNVSIIGDTLSIGTVDESGSFGSVPQSVVGPYDAWGYQGTFRGYECVVGMSSGVTAGEVAVALDVVGLICVDHVTNSWCGAFYERLAPYDFSGVTIKSSPAGSVPGELLDDALSPPYFYQ